MNDAGYTPTEINQLMHNIVDAYDKVGNVISDGWPAVSQTMQQYWVGEDEQSYENKFCERMSKMYADACQIVQDLINNIYQLGYEWHNFQKKNLLENASLPENFEFTLDEIKVSLNETIIKYRKASITDSTTRGVKAGALSAIQTSMSEYLSNIKSNLNGLYAQMDASKAFVGAQQSSAITEYIADIGQSLASVLTAANDIYNALQTLSQTSYSQSEEQVSSQFKSSNVQSDIESRLGDMKWNG